MTRIFAFLSVLCLVFVQAGAQSTRNSLSGVVTDLVSGLPLAGASIWVVDLKTGTTTNGKGEYRLNNLSEGQHLVEVSYVGYASVSEFVTIGPGSVKNFALGSSVVENDEVVVTGISTAMQARRNPTPVTVVRKQELIRTVSSNLVDALSNKPGVSQISTGPAISKPVIRGLGFNRVIVLNDGIRQEGQQWGGEHGLEIDELSVQKVEILKGPASLMYGSDAMAGVINILTNVPVQEGMVKGSFVSNYQTNNRLRSVHMNIGANNKGFNWNAYGSYKAATDYKNKYDGRVFNSRFNEKNFGGYLGYNGNWGYSHLIVSNFNQQLGVVEGERNEAGEFLKLLPGGEEAVADAADFKSIHPHVPMQEVKHFKVASDNSFQTGAGRITLNIGYQRNQRMEFANPDDYKDKELYFDLHTLTYSAANNFREINRWRITVGVNGLSQANKNKGEESLIPEYSMFDAGLFAYAQKSVEKLTFSGGLRFDNRHINSKLLEEDGQEKFAAFSRNFSNLSGSAGLSYLPSSTVALKFNLSRGFRAPSIPELASNGTHEGTNRYEYGNRNLKSETSWQADLGSEFNADHLSISASFFLNNIQNYIYYSKLPAVNGGDSLVDGNTAFVFNQQDATLAGFELVIDLHPHPFDWLHFENTFSYVRARFKDGIEGNRNIPFIPAGRWLSELRADLMKEGKLFRNLSLRLQLDNTLAQKKVFTVYETETASSGYSLLNAGLSTDLFAGGKNFASLYFNVMNIGDVAYQNHLSRLKYAAENQVTGRTGVFGMGRNFNIKLVVPLEFALGKK